MADIVRNWRVELMEAHPNVLLRQTSHPESALGYPSGEDGWRDLLERLCARLEAALRDDETIQILQIKEKFATLRVYWRSDVAPETAARLHGAIALGAARSACTCEKCGEAGRLYRHDGVWMTRCPADAKGAPVRIEAGLESFHVIRVTELRDMRVFFCRRYDRAADAFVDIPAEGLEE